MSRLSELRSKREDLERESLEEQEISLEFDRIETLKDTIKQSKRDSEDNDFKRGVRKSLVVVGKGLNKSLKGLGKGLLNLGKDTVKFVNTLELVDDTKTRRRKKK